MSAVLWDMQADAVSAAYDDYVAGLIEAEYERSLEEQERDVRREQLLSVLSQRSAVVCRPP